MSRAFAWLSLSSLAGRTLLTLLAGLLAFHIGSLWLLERGVRDAREEATAEHVAEHLTVAWRTLDALPPAMRPVVAGTLSSAGFEIGWERAGDGDPQPGQTGEASAALQARLRALLPEAGGLRLGVAQTASGPRTAGRLALSDGTALTFVTPAPRPANMPADATIASLSAMAIGIVLVSLLVVRWITDPLRRLAAAAERFGQDAGPAPVMLPEAGPREVREAARTFNAMQARIQRLVADRTQSLAAVSHDLRSPMQRLRLRAGFLDDTGAQRAIDADLDEMEAMVDGILAYLRGDAETEAMKPTDLAAVLHTVCDEATDRGAEAAYRGPDRVSLPLRPAGIKRAFGNLVDNAVKHGGGSAIVTLLDAADAVTVRVEDSGPGIPEGSEAAVFEPFRRLEGSRNRGTGGSGLGLTIARLVVDGHGGTIAVANRAEGGLAVTVRLPRSG